MNDPSSGPAQDDRIAVLYVIWSLQMGGAERVVYDLARKLDRSKFRAAVCCLNFKGRLGEALEQEGIPVFVVDKRPGFDPGVVARMARVMREQRIDVVHTHLWTSSFWGRLAARRARVPVIVCTEHNLDLWRRWPHFAADRWLARRTDHFVFVSDEVRDFYLRHLGGLAPERYHVVHNGIDLEPFDVMPRASEAREKMGLPVGRPLLGVVGRLEERKGHRYFLEAMQRLLARQPNAVGVIVGEGKEMENLRRQHQALGLGDNVRLIGYWGDLAEALAAIDVFVLPSLMEGHPLAILEAMAARRPVVATTVGGNGEAVAEGVSGVLVPPRDPGALADAMAALIADPARAQAMGQAGRGRVDERFNLKTALAVNAEIYRGCVTRKRGVPREP